MAGMKTQVVYRCLLVVVLSALGQQIVWAQRVVIATATDYCATLKREDILRLYRMQTSLVDGKAASFLDHQSNTQIYKDFIRQYFDMSEQAMSQYWQQLKLQQGKLPPKFLPEAFLVKAIKSVKGSISYYYEGQVPEGLTVVEIL